jgi:hypothetical protein
VILAAFTAAAFGQTGIPDIGSPVRSRLTRATTASTFTTTGTTATEFD